jgi:hypothetical protein
MLCSNTSLTALDLGYNSIANSGALALLKAENSTLVSLELRMNHVSHDLMSAVAHKMLDNDSRRNCDKFTDNQRRETDGDIKKEFRTKLPYADRLAFTHLPDIRPKAESEASGIFRDDGNTRFHQAVMDNHGIIQRRRLPVKTNKYSMDLV